MHSEINSNLYAEREELSLSDLNIRVKKVIQQTFPATCWVKAEMSDVRINYGSGHCYLEFVEKNPITGQMLAKARGAIWANTFRMLKPYFEKETGRTFASGLKVLVKVTVDFHELYGYSLTVIDIDPTYTLGDMLRKRMEIIRQLQEEGIFFLNKELVLPPLIRRIAVITSPTAAGYEDFLNQLMHNKGNYPFYVKLFPAIMQGEKTEESIITALDQINEYQNYFNVVVIIRGGGASSELNSFDSYLLAANCAQFPLPIITGIGHERDDTIVDMVAHTRMKTPTAVAEFLVGRMDQTVLELTELQRVVSLLATEILQKQKNHLQFIASRLPGIITNRIERSRTILHTLTGKLPAVVSGLFLKHRAMLEVCQTCLVNGSLNVLSEKSKQIQLDEQFIRMVSPDYILKRGYSLTLKDGKIVKKIEGLSVGEELVTRLANGEVSSMITRKKQIMIKNNIKTDDRE